MTRSTIATGKELVAGVGVLCLWQDAHGVSWAVSIEDTRQRYGEIDCLIAPVAGMGMRWVALHKLRAMPDPMPQRLGARLAALTAGGAA